MYFSEYMYPLIPVIWHTAATHAATAAAEIAKEICDTKLQQQSDIMEEHPEYIACVHANKVINYLNNTETINA